MEAWRARGERTEGGVGDAEDGGEGEEGEEELVHLELDVGVVFLSFLEWLADGSGLSGQQQSGVSVGGSVLDDVAEPSQTYIQSWWSARLLQKSHTLAQSRAS